MNWVDSTDRCSSDYVRFGVGFLAFLVGVSGMVANSLWAAILGAVVFLGVIVSYLGED